MLKTLCHEHMLLLIWTKKIYKKELQDSNQKEFRVEKVIKRKRDKLHVKWKVHDSYFDIWITKKDII